MRRVTIVVVSVDGEVLGQLEPFVIPTPWWQDLEPIIALHPNLCVLRLLRTSSPDSGSMGGDVTYLAEAVGPRPERLQPFHGDPEFLADDPLRMPWARPGGPAADLSWAARQVAFVGEPHQVRSWNLSSIWCIPVAGGECWLKCVPPFFGHEASVLASFGGRPGSPVVLAAEGNRMLLAAMPGVDGYCAGPSDYREILETLIGLQQAAPAGVLSAVPDWRSPALRGMVDEVVDRRCPSSRPLRALVEGWDARFSAIEECGVPDVLIHGDAHPGNARIGVHPPLVFDWGDSGYGHALLDLAVLDRHYPAPAAAQLRRQWIGLWEDAVPGCDAERAWRLIRPVAVARGAVVFQRFLDSIEPSERVYHARDVEAFLDRAADLMARLRLA
jgi:hypothetical protein